MFTYRLSMRTTPVAAAALTLGLLAGAATGATAAALITGKDIKNGTVTTKDVRNGSLTAKDLRAGVLPDEGTYYTWRVSHVGGEWQDRTSNQTIPAGTRVEGVSLSVAGDFAECPDPTVAVSSHAGPIVSGRLSEGAWHVDEDVVPTSAGGALRFTANCGGGRAVPGFNVTATFLVVGSTPSGEAPFE